MLKQHSLSEQSRFSKLFAALHIGKVLRHAGIFHILWSFEYKCHFLIISTGKEAKGNFEELEKNPVWQNLKAVKNNHVYLLDGQKWLDYSSIGQSMALDDAEHLFSK
ncbi:MULTISPECIES: ABC transporter substrate-binding protein [Paenibacillus]|jgi:hypothetical protein|uniref:ABC transporter substrate-binding protein n=1 Tax=Paenibacillus TaxID=44249 RepID=UPI0004F6800D|nr:ABC transporter substrate-binding protein [Paenibacillus sp. FSL H8-0259]AIQ29976.1 hypothetical protein P40081_18770 [Paenibacillus sp. FSL P4-0081]